jgi:threonyl-tRNA synthetase
MLVLGDREVASGQVAVRARRAGDLGSMDLGRFTDTCLEKIRTRDREG